MSPTVRTEHIANGNVPIGPFEFLDVSKSWFSQARFSDHNGRAYNRVTLAAYHLPLGKIVFPSGVGPDIPGGGWRIGKLPFLLLLQPEVCSSPRMRLPG